MVSTYFFLFIPLQLACGMTQSLVHNTQFPISSTVISETQSIISSYFSSWELINVQDTLEDADMLASIVPEDTIRLSLLLKTYSSPSFDTNVRRHSIHFSLVLTVLNEGTSHLEKFDELITSRFMAPTKRDEDYFISLSPQEQIKPVLTSKVGQTIRFKISIPFQFSYHGNNGEKFNNVLLGFTMCFYCGLGGTPKLLQIPIIGRSHGLDYLFPEFTRNGNGYKMRTSSPVKYKFTTEIREVSPGNWELVRGISKKIMDGVLPHHNYTYVVFSSPNGDTGLQYKNGSWSGCIGQILGGQADLSLTTSANPSRYQVIGFSTSAFYGWITFSTGQPKITYTWKAIFQPFTLGLWLAIILTVAIICVIFRAFGFFEYAWYNLRAGMYKDLVTQITFSLLGLGVDEPISTFARMLLGWWLLVALVFNTLYNSKIVALLAMPVYEMPPKTFEELAQSKTFKWGTDAAGGSLYSLFETSNSPIFQKIFQGMEKPKGTIGCFRESVESNFACITWVGVSDYISYRNFTIVDGKMPIVRATDIVNFVSCALAMARHAVFKPVFDKTISMLYDAGIGEKWIQDDLNELQIKYINWLKDDMNQAVLRHGDDGPVMLKLDNILGVYYIYALGHLMSLLAFFAERRYWQKHNVKRLNNSRVTLETEIGSTTQKTAPFVSKTPSTKLNQLNEEMQNASPNKPTRSADNGIKVAELASKPTAT